MQRSAIWAPHRLLPFCVLYLNKLVTVLKNVYDKWCEEKLDGGLSAPICPLRFLSTVILRRFSSEEKEKENQSCFYSSFGRQMASAQNAVWTKAGEPSCTKHNRKSTSTLTKHNQPHRLCWIWRQGLTVMMMSSFQHHLKLNFNYTIVKVSPFMIVEIITFYHLGTNVLSV